MIINFVCLYLEDLIKVYQIQQDINKTNNRIVYTSSSIKKSKFNYSKIAYNYGLSNVNLYSFCQSILKLVSQPEINLVYSIILIKRFLRISYLDLNKYNIMDLLLVANLISCKILEDDLFDNLVWSRVSRISLIDLNQLELDFFFELTENLFISCQELIETYRHIIGYLKYHNLIEEKKQVLIAEIL